MSRPFTKFILASLAFTTSLFALQDAVVPANEIGAKLKDEEKLLKGTAYLPNGDSISGEFNNFNKESVTINSPQLVDLVNFSTKEVSSITIKTSLSETTKVNPKQQEVTITLHGHSKQAERETIKGELFSIDEKHVTLKTKYAGEIKILSKFISKIRVGPEQIYLGPNSISEWHNNSETQAWEHIHNSLISTKKHGNIAQDLGLPDAAVISFDLSWKQYAMFTLYLFSSNHKLRSPDNYYSINLNNSGCSLHKVVNRQRFRTVSSGLDPNQVMLRQIGKFKAQRAATLKKKSAHYDIYVNKAKGQFYIYCDGLKLGEFTDPHSDVNKLGTALHLSSADNNPVRIKNLKISKWNNVIQIVDDVDKLANSKAKDSRFLLNNGDSLNGKINNINNGLIQIESLYTPLKIPIARMHSLYLPSSDLEKEPTMDKSSIKCWFKDEGWIILKPISIEGNTLTAFHPAIGENKFNLNGFKQVDFNTHKANTNKVPLKFDKW